MIEVIAFGLHGLTITLLLFFWAETAKRFDRLEDRFGKDLEKLDRKVDSLTHEVRTRYEALK